VEIYEPAKVMGILRMYNRNSDSEIILLAVAYLTKVMLQIPNEVRMIPEDNLYKYLYVRGNLWLDLVSPDRINTPLVGLLDVESAKPHIENLSESRKHRFIIQYPNFRDSTNIRNHQANKQFRKLLNNLFTYIPLPTEIELALFKNYSLSNMSLPDEEIVPLDNIDIETDVDT